MKRTSPNGATLPCGLNDRENPNQSVQLTLYPAPGVALGHSAADRVVKCLLNRERDGKGI